MNDTPALSPGHGSITMRWAAVVRFSAAIVFIVFGVGKFVQHTSEVASFSDYGLPSPDAFVYAVGLLEIGGGLLLLTGLLLRPTALALAANMLGAIVVSGLALGEIISLTLAPALLLAMGFLVYASS